MELQKLVDDRGSGAQIALLLRLVPHQNAIGAGPKAPGERRKLARAHLRRGTRTGTVLGIPSTLRFRVWWLGSARFLQHPPRPPPRQPPTSELSLRINAVH